MDELVREITLALWKIHILHHAAERPVYGQWIMEELRRHGYRISPGTLYPLLRRMERHGWLLRTNAGASGKARQEYALGPQGAPVLADLRARVRELYRELAEGTGPERPENRHAEVPLA